MLRQLTTLLLFLLAPLIWAQTSDIDSLRLELSNHDPESEEFVQILTSISEAFVQIDRDSMLFYAKWALSLSDNPRYPYHYLYALQRVGVYHYVHLNFDSANVIFERGYRLSKEWGFLERQASYLGSIGINQYAQGNVDSGLAALEMALPIDKALKDTIKLFTRYNNLGAIYSSVENEAKALVYLMQALELAQAFHSNFRVYAMANNIGVIFNESGNYKEALIYFELALQHIGDERIPKLALLSNIANLYLAKDSLARADLYFNMAIKAVDERNPCNRLNILTGIMDLKLRMGELDSALYYQKLAAKDVQACKDSNHLYQFYLQRGLISRKQGFNSIALKDFEKAQSYGKPGNRHYSKVFLELSKIYKARGQHEIALSYYEQFNRQFDRQLRNKYARDLARMKLTYDFEQEKAKLVENQEKETAAIKEDLRYYQDQRVFWTVVSALLLLLILILAYFYQLRKRREEDLFDLNQIITKQKENLQSKSEQLVLSNKKIQELSEFRERLAAMAVHDMKGPLSSIIGLADGEMTKRKQGLIRKAGSQMLQFLMDLLDIYKFEKANIALKLLPHDISKLIREAWHASAYLAEERQVSLELEIKKRLIVPVDEGILVRVLTNILTNAIRYSPEQSELIIKVSESERKNVPSLLIAIIDKGPGISQEKMERMFEPMNLRKENYISKSTSTGIGLDFCKLAVQAHHGRIWAESELGEGTTVFIELPQMKDQSVEVDLEAKPKKTDAQIQNLEPYLNQLADFKIHEAGKILKVLGQLEQDGGDVEWISKIRATVYAADEALYQKIIKKEIKDGL